MEIPPVQVRMSPGELDDLKRKADRMGLTVSAAIRAAAAAWHPEAVTQEPNDRSPTDAEADQAPSR